MGLNEGEIMYVFQVIESYMVTQMFDVLRIETKKYLL